jgi:hypothetical protein
VEYIGGFLFARGENREKKWSSLIHICK